MTTTMTIDEAVQKMNEGQAKRKDIADMLGISANTLTRKIKSSGYEYDNVTKKYKVSEVSSELPTVALTSATLENQVKDQVEETDPKKIRMGSEKVKNNERQKVELTDLEILKLKRLLSERDHNFLYMMLQDIPYEDSNKRSILITDSTYKEFEEFSNEVKHISKNQLIELALIDFMGRYR